MFDNTFSKLSCYVDQPNQESELPDRPLTTNPPHPLVQEAKHPNRNVLLFT